MVMDQTYRGKKVDVSSTFIENIFRSSWVDPRQFLRLFLAQRLKTNKQNKLKVKRVQDVIPSSLKQRREDDLHQRLFFQQHR